MDDQERFARLAPDREALETMSVGREGGASRIEMIAVELAAEIAGGAFAVGERFTPEPDLQARFNVGRHTIREALKVLTEQGLVGRRRKTGTFVLSANPVSPYVHSLRDLRGLLDFAETTRLEISHVDTLAGTSALLADFDDLPDQRWLRLAGLRTLRDGGSPLCWSEILIPVRFSPPTEQLVSLSRALYEEILSHNGLRLEYVEQEVTAVLLEPSMLNLLSVKDSPAGLLVKRRYVAHTGETFEISHNLYPAARYRIRSVIRQRA